MTESHYLNMDGNFDYELASAMAPRLINATYEPAPPQATQVSVPSNRATGDTGAHGASARTPQHLPELETPALVLLKRYEINPVNLDTLHENGFFSILALETMSLNDKQSIGIAPLGQQKLLMK